MPLSNILKSAAGTCQYCGNKAGLIAREHPQCRRTHDAGFQEMVNLAAESARDHSFNEKTLRLTLAGIAGRSHGDGNTVNLALEEGWKRGVAHSMADGILTQERRADSGSSGTASPSPTPAPTGRRQKSSNGPPPTG